MTARQGETEALPCGDDSRRGVLSRWLASAPSGQGIWLLLGWMLLVVGLFWPYLTGEALVGYRDSAQFYWPMFRWADAVWAAGELPLWTPHDGLGRSHLAEGISSLFYPGKIVFGARWMSFEARYGWYLALHVWLAGWGAGWLAGQFRADWCGRGLATLSYGLSGPVLFATTNVIYLVSAAWLPWGLGAINRWRNPLQRREAVLGTAAVAALMILGGDPQMAENLLLIAMACWGWWGWREYSNSSAWRTVGAAVLSWLATVALAGSLAAVQLLPSWGSSAGSERMEFREPRSLPEWLVASWRAGSPQSLGPLWLEPQPETHHADVYEFSQPPWTLLEWVWPGSSGRPFPEWTHWVSSLPGAGRMWQPSLYQGVLPLLFALLALRRREIRWLVVVGGVALLGAWGWYGPVWLVNEAGLATGWWNPLEGVNRAAGGVYWWLVCLVPGYIWFRYPAKLVMLTTLALAIAASWGWTNWHAPERHCGRPRNWLLYAAGLSAVVLVIAFCQPWAKSGLAESGDDWFGPFASQRFGWQLTVSGLHTLVVSLIGWWLLGGSRSSSPGKSGRLVLLGLCAAELCGANAWLLAGTNLPTGLPTFAGKLPVCWDQPEAPAEWREQGSPDRLDEVVRWAIADACPRVHWLWGERMLNAPATIEQRDWLEFRTWLAAGNRGQQPGDLLTGELLFDSERVWVLCEPQSVEQLKDKSLIECFRLGLVEGLSEDRPAARRDSSLRLAGRVSSRTTQSVTVEVELPEAGVVFLSEAFAPGWSSSGRELSSGREVQAECLRVGGWLRGVWLDAGKYVLRFTYYPPEINCGVIVSAIGWICLLIHWLSCFFSAYRKHNIKPAAGF